MSNYKWDTVFAILYVLWMWGICMLVFQFLIQHPKYDRKIVGITCHLKWIKSQVIGYTVRYKFLSITSKFAICYTLLPICAFGEGPSARSLEKVLYSNQSIKVLKRILMQIVDMHEKVTIKKKGYIFKLISISIWLPFRLIDWDKIDLLQTLSLHLP